MQSLKNKFEILRMPPENTNSVLLSRGDDAVIFDPWGRGDDWGRVLDARGLNLRAIYATHGHPDHIAAAPELVSRYNVPFYMAADDRNLIGWGNGLLDFFEMPHVCAHCLNPVDLTPGMHTVMGGVEMNVIAAPGHTAGGRMFYFPTEHILLTGDTIFSDGFGRYDLPGGDQSQLFETISKLYEMNLPDDTYVVHGHGMDSTIARLKEHNSYFKSI